MNKKILVLRFSSIGDIVLTTPVIRCLKKQLNAEIHFLTKTSFERILANNPYIDRLWTFNITTSEVVAALKQQHFDYVVDLHNNIRTLKLKSQLGVKSSIFPKLNAQKWLYVNFKLDVMPDVHVVERYFAAVEKLGVKSDGFGLDFFLNSDDEININQLLPDDFQGGFFTLTLGAQFKTKCLPEAKIKDLLSMLTFPVVLLGGKEDQELGERLAALFRGNVVNQAGKLTLGQSASLLKQSRAVIAHDTGLMHIASAFQKPIALIWGNTTPKIGMYPYQVKAPVRHFEVANLSCRPCSKIGFQSCPKKHFKCMEQQDLVQIVSFLNTLVKQH